MARTRIALVQIELIQRRGASMARLRPLRFTAYSAMSAAMINPCAPSAVHGGRLAAPILKVTRSPLA